MQGYLIIDCGTTNLRVTLLDAERREVEMIKVDGGVRHTVEDGHNGHLRRILKESIQTILQRNGYEEKDIIRCVASGMITSALGLLEVLHVAAPAGVEELRNAMQSKIFEDIASFPIEFIPGVRNFSEVVSMENFSEMDMMRGEEVEAIGLYRKLKLRHPAIFVLPGTHNKFVAMDAKGRITGCMTSISGEILDALTHHTILSDAVGRDFVSENQYDAEYACAGAKECAVNGLGRAAFAGRILNTLGGKSPEKIRSYLLGAVLALDVQALQTFVGEQTGMEAYVAGKAPIQRAFCDVMHVLAAGEAVQVSQEISACMGLEGAMEIALG